MKNVVAISLILLLTLTNSTKGLSQSTPNCNNLIGVWHNQLGSTLTITSINAANGQITGTYISPSGTAGQAVVLIGWVNKAAPAPKGDNAVAIVFSVNWGKYGTITSWTGYCGTDNAGNPQITTIWNLVSANSDYTWDHILTNSDIFKPGPPRP